MKRKVLFIAAHRPDRAPGQRFRFEQYFDHLASNGYEPTLSYLISERDDRVFYAPGGYLRKGGIFLRSFARRSLDALRASDYDIIFIFREAFLTGTTLFESLFDRSRAKLVFDFDDAIWLPNISEGNRALGWLKNPRKTEEIIAMSDMVFAGNPYLAEYASGFSDCVKIVPTTIDTEEYRPRTRVDAGPVCIGWSGSVTTIPHFEYALPALTEIKRRYGDRICFRVIGDGGYTNPALGIQGVPWRRESEVADLTAIDIGIMPLPDDAWARGKCGLKGLQYMALEIPTIMSPVGVNTEIVSSGTNGFLATATEEWVEALAKLVESTELRRQIGTAGRRTVLERYSTMSQRDNYVRYFDEVLAAKAPRRADGARSSSVSSTHA